MPDTFSELITRTSRRLSQSPGTSVQIYSEDVIAEMLQSGFNAIFDEFWLPDYSEWLLDLALNATTGVVTVDLTSASYQVDRFTDIYGVWFNTDERKLPIISNNTNPNNLSGTRPVGITPTTAAGKFFKVWPLESVGDVHLYVKQRPDSFLDDAEQDVKMDSDLLIFRSVWDYLTDDGTNPGAEEKFRLLYEQRLDQVKHLLNRGPILLSTARVEIPTTWEER